MKIGIVGGGAVGLLTALHLSKQHETALFVRNELQKRELNNKGIRCNKLHAEVEAFTDAAYFNDQDLLIITVKQYDVPAVLEQLPPSLPVLFLQNGMSHLDSLEPLSNPCGVGVVEHGAVRISNYEVSHTGKGVIYLADFHNFLKGEELAEELTVEGFKFLYRENYWSMLAEKVVINTVINPLTALFNVKNKEILLNPHIYELAEKLCLEACEVLDLSFEEQWKRVLRVAERTGENQSSMLRDLLEHRKTEVEAISGYILKKSDGRALYHFFVVNAIHALELKSKGESL
ncbi:2-dehydropantoate 2-reductase [Halobacillus sp. A5]|uniref:2-dehydropantoate 2-reductase n=1 Tax=Halobacillus sp. A5 TaxID=2880263 RepID=UPI0020A66EBD|nr:2-dehydropantoate 2-reductase [Halobacillus sp. A5]MCP3026219.1 2-dehydropantoate 2-reductase [Halobacillus sp. A5]